MTHFIGKTALVALMFTASAGALAQDASSRASATEKAMTDAERTVLTHGIMAIPAFIPTKMPEDAVPGAGYIAGIPRLGVPALTESDASLGVAWVMGMRKDGATALPSGMAQGSTWNADLVRAGGAMIGSEAKAKGFNVLLAGGQNLIRDPRGGRTFEYFSEDPLLSGTLAGASISGIQSNHIISTMKHFAFNNQETARNFIDVHISEAAARESDLLSFEIAAEKGNPGSAMCSYNKVNGAYACDNDWLLNKVLKGDWGWKGFVMSDWGAVPSLTTALHGLDQQSGAQLDPKIFFEKDLAAAAASDPAYKAKLSDMNRRVLWAMYANGVSAGATTKSAIDFAADAKVAEATAKEGIVLLRNQGGALPMLTSAKRVAVIGGYADSGVLSGAGSSQVHDEKGPAVVVSMGGDGPYAGFISQQYHHGAPLTAMKTRAPNTKFDYHDGRYISEAVTAAKKADSVVIFATQWSTEGIDLPDLNLPGNQDALIAAVAAANPHTIVVLETGSPVIMPWLDKTAAVMEAWFSGARGGEAIASVLYGETNPSGHLPVSFPASLDQLPHPELPGLATLDSDFQGHAKPGEKLSVDYDVEGSDIGYRWFARSGTKPAFPFGYGLSYTSFAHSGLKVSGGAASASFTVKNTGARDGADVPQLYLVNQAGKAVKRLAGFSKVALKAGESRAVSVAIDPRLLANWAGNGWEIKAGGYGFALGASADDLGPVTTVNLTERHIKP